MQYCWWSIIYYKYTVAFFITFTKNIAISQPWDTFSIRLTFSTIESANSDNSFFNFEFSYRNTYTFQKRSGYASLQTVPKKVKRKILINKLINIMNRWYFHTFGYVCKYVSGYVFTYFGSCELFMISKSYFSCFGIFDEMNLIELARCVWENVNQVIERIISRVDRWFSHLHFGQRSVSIVPKRKGGNIITIYTGTFFQFKYNILYSEDIDEFTSGRKAKKTPGFYFRL